MRSHLCHCIAIALVIAAVGPPASAQTEGVYSEYLLGSYLLEQGEVAAAVDYFERAWRLSDRDDAIAIRLAESYYLLKNFTRCEMVLDDILDGVPNDRDALIMKAKVRYIQRDTRGAVLNLERVREHYPISFEVERLLGNIYYEMAEIEKALEAYERCLGIDSSYPYIQYRYGRLLIADGRPREAEAAFRRAAELDPSFAEPNMALIELLLDDGRTEEALPLLEEAVIRDPRNERGMIMLATIYLERGRIDDGLALVEAWTEHSPLSHDGEVLLGRLRFEKGDYEGAQEVFARLFEDNPGSAELARILAEIRLKSDDTAGAREYFERAIAITPEDYRSYLALFFASTQRFADTDDPSAVIELSEDERRALLTSASNHLPVGDFDANYLLGVSFLSIDALEEAETFLLRANELRARDYRTLFNLATVFEKRREYERAEDYLVVMLDLRPDDSTTLNFYGYLLALMGKDLPRALEMLQTALAAEPDNGYFLDSLGWIYYQMGDYARAVVELEKAASIVKDDPVILEHLGDAYAASRRFDEARSAYLRSHELQGGNGILEKIESTRDQR